MLEPSTFNWLFCCNKCVQGKASLLTNCGHLFCTKCCQPQTAQCPICAQNCSVLEIKQDLMGVPEQISVLFQPIDKLFAKFQKQVHQVIEFQNNHQNRLLSNLRSALKRASEKNHSLNQIISQNKSEIEALNNKIMELQIKINRNCNSMPIESFHSKPIDTGTINAQNFNIINSKKINDNQQQFLLDFTPLKNNTTPLKTTPTHYLNDQPNSINPNHRISLQKTPRNDQNQHEISMSMIRTPSPHLSTTKTSTNSYWSPYAAASSSINSNAYSKIDSLTSSTPIVKVHNKEPNQHQRPYSTGKFQNDLRDKANNALLRLSQSLASKSISDK